MLFLRYHVRRTDEFLYNKKRLQRSEYKNDAYEENERIYMSPNFNSDYCWLLGKDS